MARIYQSVITTCQDYLGYLLTWKGYMLVMVTTIAFTQLVLAIFGNTIPNVFLLVFGNTIPNVFLLVFGNIIPGVFQTTFKAATNSVILGAVFVFAMAWLLKAKPHHRPKMYRVVIFDVFGQESAIDGLRLNFANHDVAWSYMKQYKEMYPLHNFALVSDISQSKPTIYRYI